MTSNCYLWSNLKFFRFGSLQAPRSVFLVIKSYFCCQKIRVNFSQRDKNTYIFHLCSCGSFLSTDIMILQKDRKSKDLYLCNTLGPVVRKPIEGDPSLVFGAQSNMTLGSKAPYTTSVTWICAVKSWERGYGNPRLKVNRSFCLAR